MDNDNVMDLAKARAEAQLKTDITEETVGDINASDAVDLMKKEVEEGRVTSVLLIGMHDDGSMTHISAGSEFENVIQAYDRLGHLQLLLMKDLLLG